jgi:hypothetical protein
VHRRNRTTAPGGIPGTTGPPPIGVARRLRAALELARSAAHVRHRPTLAQLRTMAVFDGRQPASYRLDAAVNWLPESLPADFPHGSDGLRFAHAGGELVALPNGWGFSL